jgi:hypothetical protein
VQYGEDNVPSFRLLAWLAERRMWRRAAPLILQPPPRLALKYSLGGVVDDSHLLY